MPGEELVRSVAQAIGVLAEAIAVMIIGFSMAVAVWGSLRSLVTPTARHPWDRVRLDLGRSLGLALEFLLAADIVRTAVAPTWEDIGQLAAIAVIRTGLNYFLHRDIQEVERAEARRGAEVGKEREFEPAG